MSNDPFYLGAAPDDPERLLVLDIAERRVHVAIVGASGAGKSCLLLDLAGQDVAAGRGFTSVDPKGDLVDDVIAVLATAPEESWPALARDVVLIDPSDHHVSARFNPLEITAHGTPARQRQDVMAIFRKIWQFDDAQTARMVLVLRRALQLAIAHHLTLPDLPRILTDQDYRERLVASADDEELRRFWTLEFPADRGAQLQWAQSSLLRLESFLDDPNVRTFLGAGRSSFDFRDIMDASKICLISLSKGRLGQETSDLVGGLLLTRFQLAAESRQRMPQGLRRQHWLYCDEVQNIATTFEDFLAEARGYGVSVILAHQNLAQLPPRLREAILSNCRIKVSFRVSHEDATILAREFWRITGERVKDRQLAWMSIGRVPLPVGYQYDFYSVGDEGRQNRETLHYLADRLMAVHVAGRPAPYLARTVDVPRAELDRSGERVDRFKRVLADVQRQPAVEPAPETPALPAARTFEWAGRSEPSAPVGS